MKTKLITSLDEPKPVMIDWIENQRGGLQGFIRGRLRFTIFKDDRDIWCRNHDCRQSLTHLSVEDAKKNAQWLADTSMDNRWPE